MFRYHKQTFFEGGVKVSQVKVPPRLSESLEMSSECNHDDQREAHHHPLLGVRKGVVCYAKTTSEHIVLLLQWNKNKKNLYERKITHMQPLS